MEDNEKKYAADVKAALEHLTEWVNHYEQMKFAAQHADRMVCQLTHLYRKMLALGPDNQDLVVNLRMEAERLEEQAMKTRGG